VFVRPGSPRVLARRAVLGSLAASVAVVGLPGFAAAIPPTTPFISEFHYDNAGTDTGEFIEVEFPRGTTSVGWSVVLYNGGTGSTHGKAYGTQALPTVTGRHVAVLEVVVQNGNPDGLALVDGDGDVREFLSYGGEFTATDGPAVGLKSANIGVSESATTPVGSSLSRVYDPATDRLVWSGPAKASAGALNDGTESDAQPKPYDPCADTVTHAIGAVQGTGSSTPLAGDEVIVRGVVVGDLPSFHGFYLQDSDGNPDTSDGIFVRSDADVSLGDTVAVKGIAGEGFGQTEVVAGANAAVCTPGDAADLPASAPLDLPATAAERELLESMLVTPVDTLTVSEVYALTSFGELMLSEGGVLVQPTELARPGTPEAQAMEAENLRRQIVLDDGLDSSRSATNRPYLSTDNPVRVGDAVAFTSSPLVLGYAYGKWRLQPADGDAQDTFAAQNTRPVVPAPVGGDVQVGAFNVLNYFLTFGDSETARGARNAGAFEKQAAKIVTAIGALDADVVTLMEVEDTDSTGYTAGNADTALADLVRRLNKAAGSDVWSYVPLPQELYAIGVDRDVIRNGIIYRNDVVQPVGSAVGLVDESVWFNAREPIAQTFVKDDDTFTVVANHFKSKSAGDSTGDNADAGDGQGEWNGDRQRQAASLAQFTDTLRASTGDDDVVLMGDFNAYTQEDPIEVLRQAGYTDLGTEFDEGRYSYVFNNLSGSLDHALATEALTAKVTDVTHWNINAVESFAYQYTGDPALYAANPFRSSDHDPLLLGIDLDNRCQGLEPTIVGTPGDDVISGTSGRDVIVGLGGNDVIRGGNGDDVICGGLGNDTIAGDNGDDVVLGGYGDDAVSGDNGSDRLIGGPGKDTLDQGRGKGTEQQAGASA